MGKFRELEEFEARFEAMDASELARWKVYWTQHAQNLAPKVRKEAMRRVHRIDKALQQALSEKLD
jgi:hypothetical protein